VGAVAVNAATSSDCGWTTPPDTVGTSFDQVRAVLAHRYAVGPGGVVQVIRQDRDVVDLAVFVAEARGRDAVLVRVVRASSGRGWLIATNTCGSQHLRHTGQNGT
jgi:hypothetical protein